MHEELFGACDQDSENYCCKNKSSNTHESHLLQSNKICREVAHFQEIPIVRWFDCEFGGLDILVDAVGAIKPIHELENNIYVSRSRFHVE